MTTTDPIRRFEYNGTMCELKSVTKSLNAGVNQAVVTAVTGKRIAVMRLFGQSSNAAIGAVLFKSNSGGTTIMNSVWFPLATTAGELLSLPLEDSPYFETSTGHGLYADVATDYVNFTLNYIEYTP